MQSLRQLTDQLIGVRLDADNIPSWEARAEVREYARVAINDAIAAFPTRVQMVYTSGVASGNVVVLPKDVRSIVRVEACATTGITRYTARHWHLVPTPTTAYLHLYDDVDGRMDITYLYTQPALPADLGVVRDSLTLVSATPSHTASHLWPSSGYVELSGAGFPRMGKQREIIHYGATWNTHDGMGMNYVGGFKDLTREVEGARAPEYMGANPSDTLSACWVCADADLRPVMLLAQAVMYEFWLRHYALYTDLVGKPALGLEDLQILIRDLEGRAQVARHSKRRLPVPSSARLRKPIPE